MTIYGRSEELVSRCVECDLAEPESLASLGGSTPGLVDGILSLSQAKLTQTSGSDQQRDRMMDSSIMSMSFSMWMIVLLSHMMPSLF